MKKFILTIITLTFLLPFAPAVAQDFTSELGNAGSAVYEGAESRQDLFLILGRVIQGILSLMGVVLLIMVIYAGMLWMTAGGKPDQLQKAKTMLINAIIGITIVISSYAIANFVIQSF